MLCLRRGHSTCARRSVTTVRPFGLRQLGSWSYALNTQRNHSTKSRANGASWLKLPAAMAVPYGTAYQADATLSHRPGAAPSRSRYRSCARASLIRTATVRERRAGSPIRLA